MLLLKPLFTVNKVTVFPDHADKDTFYYLPENIGIAKDATGKPRFLFMKYMRDLTDNVAFKSGQQLGGGFVTVTVDCALDDQTRRDIISRARRTGSLNPQLVTAPFHEGTVRIVSLDSAAEADPNRARFVERAEGSTVPSLFGDLTSTFSIMLSQEGSTLMEKSFDGGSGGPICVFYDVKFMALRPAFEVRVKANMKRVYESFEAGLAAQYMIFRADIEAQLAKLEHDQVLKIEVLTFAEDDGTRAAKDAAMAFLKEQVINQFFTPSLPLPTSGGRGGADPLAGLASALGLGGRTLGQGAPAISSPPPVPGAAVSQTGRAAAAPPPHPPTDVTAATTPAALATSGTANPAAAPSAPTAPTAPPSANALGGGGAGSGGVPAMIGLRLRFVRQEEIKNLDLIWKEAGPVERQHTPNGTFGLLLSAVDRGMHMKTVNLDDPDFRRILIDTSGGGNWTEAGLTLCKIHLEYGDDGQGRPHHVDDLELKPNAQGVIVPQIFTCSLDRERSLDVKYFLDFFFDDTAAIRAKAAFHRTPTMVLTGPLGTIEVQPKAQFGFISIEAGLGVSFKEWGVSQVMLKLGYNDSANAFTFEEGFTLSDQNLSAKLKIRTINPLKLDWWYEPTYVFPGGRTLIGPRVSTTDPTVTVEMPWRQLLDVTLDPFDLSGLKRIALEVEYVDQDHAHEFKKMIRIDDPANYVQFKVPTLDDKRQTYRYRVNAVTANNQPLRGPWVEAGPGFGFIQKPA